jgi:hypothetical protein
MLAGGGEVMCEGMTAELVIGRTEEEVVDVDVEDRARLVDSGNFFWGSLLGDSASFTAYYFGLAKLHKLWIPQRWPFCRTAETVDCRMGLFRKEKEKQIPLEQVLSMWSGCWVRSKSQEFEDITWQGKKSI